MSPSSLYQNCDFAQKVLATVENVIVVMDPTGLIIEFNQAAEGLSGYRAEELVGQVHWSILVPDCDKDQVNEVFSSLTAVHFPNTKINRWQTKNGEWLMIKWHNTAITDSENRIQYVVATGVDITEQVKVNEALAISAKALETGEAIIITDQNGTIIRTNRVFNEVTGYSDTEVIGKTPAILKSGKHDATFYEALWEELSESGFWSGDVWNKRKNGEIYPEHLKISAVYDDLGQVTNYVASFTDLSRLHKAENKVKYLANYDVATGLPNRAYFMTMLQKSIDKSHASNQEAESGHAKWILLLHIRLHKLSKLNSQYGMEVTDELLSQYVEKLEEIRSDTSGVCARLTGSDFALLVETIPFDGLVDKAKSLAQALVRYGKGLSLESGDLTLNLSPKVGICSYPDFEDGVHNGTTANQLVEHGLLGSYEAIDHDENFRFYSKATQKLAEESSKLERSLIHALRDKSEFELYHQPQFHADGTIRGGEALIRWHHKGAFIPPSVFIPFAEKSGFMVEIGYWVLERSVDELIILREKGLLTTYQEMSVNFSPKQLMDSNFLKEFEALRQRYPFIARHLKLEVTETAFIEDLASVKYKLERIKALGFKISIDDFGTGYSSLTYLSELEFDEIKIDKSFVDKVHLKTHKACKITRSILGIAEAIGVDVVAEGIESESQFEFLKALNCTHFQGYYLSRPMPFSDLLNYIERYSV